MLELISSSQDAASSLAIYNPKQFGSFQIFKQDTR